MNITMLLDRFNKFCAERGFEPKKSIGLLSPVFPHEFNVSGGHNYAMEILNNPNSINPLIKYSLFEKSFRRIDLERVGYSDHHLSFFQIALFAYGGNREQIKEILEESITHMATFLTQTLGIPKKRLVITVFDGGRVKNFEIPKELFWRKWMSTGFTPEQIIPIKGRRNIVFSETEGAAVCPTCEIFFDKGNQFEKSRRFVEIGSVNLYKYIFKHKENKLFTPINWVNISIIGIERLLMVLQDVRTIFDVDCISPIINLIESNLQNCLENEIFTSSTRTIADRIRAIAFICIEGVEINSTPQGKVLKKLVKQLVSQMRYLNIYNIDLIGQAIDEIIPVYKGLYPDLSNIKEKAVSLISSEIEKREETYE